MSDADFRARPVGDPWNRIARLDACQSYIVLVTDPQLGEADAHGPFSGLEATFVADRIRRDVDSLGLTDIQVCVTRLHTPAPELSR